jgi:superfamily II DNA or RNA helicase
MMKTCIIQVLDEVNIKLVNLDADVRRKLASKFSYDVPGAKYMPAVRLGRWNGKESFFSIAGSTYLNLLPEIIPILEKEGYDFELDDKRQSHRQFHFDPVSETTFDNRCWPEGHPIAGQPIVLRDYQVSAINSFLANPQCLQELVTGAGKTISCAALSATVEKYGRTLIIVPNKSLVSQTLEDYVNMGLDTGVYCGDKKELNKTHTICTWQALNVMLKNTQAGTIETTIHEFIEGVVCVIVDECHQLRANSLKALLTGPFANIPIRWGLTGTIPKEQYEFMSLFCSIGQVIGRLSAKELQDEGHLSNCHINIIQLVDHSEFTDYQKELKFLTENSDRLDEIVKIIDKIKTSGNTLVLVDRVASGKEIAARLGEDAVFVSGSTKSKNRKEEYDSISNSDGKVIVATYGVASTGINIPRLFNIVLIEPGRSFVRCIQSIGRGLRKAHDKNHVEIYDITSTCRFSKRHLTKRIQYYKDAQYPYSKEKLEWR